MIHTQHKQALILVDLQNDFCEGGSLAVPSGDEVVPLANQLQDYFEWVLASKDWHPHGHGSFASSHPGYSVGELIKVNGSDQVLWPDHCVQYSPGAEFHPALNTSKIKKTFYKGTDPFVDSYSAFFDNEHIHATGLDNYLKQEKISEIFVMGLATDYCVKFTCLDAVQLGFNVYVIADACRGVELNTGDIQQALEEMQLAGVKIISMADVISAKSK